MVHELDAGNEARGACCGQAWGLWVVQWLKAEHLITGFDTGEADIPSDTQTHDGCESSCLHACAVLCCAMLRRQVQGQQWLCVHVAQGTIWHVWRCSR